MYYRYDLVRSLLTLGRRLKAGHRTPEAIDALREARAVGDKLAAETPPAVSYIHNRVGQVYVELVKLLIDAGRVSEANDLKRRIIECSSDAGWLNGQAWALATHPEEKSRDPALALAMARKAVALEPEVGPSSGTRWAWRCYRTGDWKGAIAGADQSEELAPNKHLGFNAFFLAMAHWQLGHKDEARAWYDRAVAWTDKHGSKNERAAALPRRGRGIDEEGAGEKTGPTLISDFGLQSGRRGPYRQASPPPARHRPGARSAPGTMSHHSIADQPGKGERTMSFHSWLPNFHSTLAPGRGQRHRGRRGTRRATPHRPSLEFLEARSVPAFLAPVDYTVGGYLLDVVAADFNNDTVPDLAVLNAGNNTVSVLLSNGDGTFQAARTSATGGYPHSLAVGDLDGDGNLDLATANDYEVSILLGDGEGTFTPRQRHPPRPIPAVRGHGGLQRRRAARRRRKLLLLPGISLHQRAAGQWRRQFFGAELHPARRCHQ